MARALFEAHVYIRYKASQGYSRFGQVVDLRAAIQLNLPVLMKAATAWVDVFDYDGTGSARTPPLPALVKEVLTS